MPSQVSLSLEQFLQKEFDKGEIKPIPPSLFLNLYCTDTPSSSTFSNILDKKCTKEDKVNRLISIDDEKQNEEICDYVVKVTNRDYEASVKEIIDILGI